MPLSQVHIYTPDTPLGMINDDLAQMYEELNTPTSAPAAHTHVEADITDLGTYATAADLTTAEGEIDTLQANETQIWIPAQAFDFDTAATNPAYRVFSTGGSRLSAIEIPTGASNIYLWTGLARPSKWPTGEKVKGRIVYSLDTSGVALDVVRFVSSGYGYDSGDAFASPTVNWNETDDVDVSSLTLGLMYDMEFVETSAVLEENIYISFRLNLARAAAAYTYGGSVQFYGVMLDLV